MHNTHFILLQNSIETVVVAWLHRLQSVQISQLVVSITQFPAYKATSTILPITAKEVIRHTGTGVRIWPRCPLKVYWTARARHYHRQQRPQSLQLTLYRFSALNRGCRKLLHTIARSRLNSEIRKSTCSTTFPGSPGTSHSTPENQLIPVPDGMIANCTALSVLVAFSPL